MVNSGGSFLDSSFPWKSLVKAKSELAHTWIHPGFPFRNRLYFRVSLPLCSNTCFSLGQSVRFQFPFIPIWRRPIVVPPRDFPPTMAFCVPARTSFVNTAVLVFFSEVMAAARAKVNRSNLPFSYGLFPVFSPSFRSLEDFGH